jgi:hypothetical protein
MTVKRVAKPVEKKVVAWCNYVVDRVEYVKQDWCTKQPVVYQAILRPSPSGAWSEVPDGQFKPVKDTKMELIVTTPEPLKIGHTYSVEICEYK